MSQNENAEKCWKHKMSKKRRKKYCAKSSIALHMIFFLQHYSVHIVDILFTCTIGISWKRVVHVPQWQRVFKSFLWGSITRLMSPMQVFLRNSIFYVIYLNVTDLFYAVFFANFFFINIIFSCLFFCIFILCIWYFVFATFFGIFIFWNLL